MVRNIEHVEGGVGVNMGGRKLTWADGRWRESEKSHGHRQGRWAMDGTAGGAQRKSAGRGRERSRSMERSDWVQMEMWTCPRCAARTFFIANSLLRLRNTSAEDTSTGN